MSDRPSPFAPIAAPFASVARDLVDLVRNPTAFVGGLAGSSLCIAASVALALFGTPVSAADEPVDDELKMDFVPGALVRKGPPPDPDPIPVKPIVDAQRADAPPPDTGVTIDPTLKPAPPPKPRDHKPRPKPSDPVDPDQQGKPSDHNTDGNNTYNDKPTQDRLPGDLFGKTNGWADRMEDGDPWATAVLAALNGLTVGSYAGLGQDVTYKFQIILCADGKIEAVRTKDSTGKAEFDGQIVNALETLKLPKAPADIAQHLAGDCKKIPYIFTWSGKGGQVK